MNDLVLEATDVATSFRTARGTVHAVDGVSLALSRGEAVGIVGESGSGKSVLVRSIMGLVLLDSRASRTGSINLDGVDVGSGSLRSVRKHWGSDIAMVLQDPLSSLNPVRTIGVQLTETLRRHGRVASSAQARERAAELLREVGIADPVRRLSVYPHQLSGGMRQRVMIAIALAGDPKVLICDEPTTALDVTVQAQILELLDRERRTRQMGLLLVTHDLALVAARTERVMVMYGGQIVESATTADLFARPRMPYTRALLNALPTMSGPRHVRLAAVPGTPPDLSNPPVGCRFADRCEFAVDKCRTEQPPLLALPEHPTHEFRCHFPLEVASAADTAVDAVPTGESR